VISRVVEISATVVDVLFLVWFVPKFNGASIRERPRSLIWAALLLVFQLFADRYLGDAFVLYATLDFALALMFSLSLRRQKRLWYAFGAFVYVIVVMLSNTLVYTVFMLFIDGVDAILQAGILHVRIVYILSCKIVQLAFFRLLITFFGKDRTLDLKNGILSFSFTLMTGVGLGVLAKTAIEHDFAGIEILVLTVSFILVALNIILYTMIYQLQGLMKSKYELSLIKERVDFERARTEEAAVVWENIRKLKHDLKNHFTVLRGKLEDSDHDFCKRYLSELDSAVDSMGNLIRSGNSVIDYIINSKLSSLDGVHVMVSGYVEKYSDIEDVDLACILGNIIDNAIEAQRACEGEKRIELSFLQKNSNRIIICKNTVSCSVLKKNRDLRSTKSGEEMHGLGHKIVEGTVQKYKGMVDYFEEDGFFGVQIVLPLNG
jgi:signal transduction histidine kinase